MVGSLVQAVPRRLIASVVAMVLGAGGAVTYLVVRASGPQSAAGRCVNSTGRLPSLFSSGDTTAIRLSRTDLSDLKVLRTEPSAVLPGMFDSLLALSTDARRLAYVTARTETMADAHLWWIDVARPGQRHQLAAVARGLAPIRPAWSPSARQVAYVVRTGPTATSTGTELWVASTDGRSQKRRSLPADTFGRGRTAAICWSSDSGVGMVAGLESVQTQPGPFNAREANPASTPSGVASPSSQGSSATSGPVCGVPVMSQNDPAWQDDIMQVGGDQIGGYGCALTSTAMLMDYYGAAVTPAQLNTCLAEAADPLYWASAPGCTGGKVSGGDQSNFSWGRLDAILGDGRPAIVGLVGGITGMHFVVVTSGGGGLAQSYRITDPWDGTTTKSLGSYISTGFNPSRIITYDGESRNCGRLVQGPPPAVEGVGDGEVRHGSVHLVPRNFAGYLEGMTLWRLSGAGPGWVPVQPATSKVLGPIDVAGDGVWQVVTNGRRPDGTSFVSVTKFTIADQPPAVSVQWLDPAPNPPNPSRPTLLRPGQVRIDALSQSGVTLVQYQLDGGAWTNASDIVDVARTITVPDAGDHRIAYRATDLAGNVSDVGSADFTVIDAAGSPPPAGTPQPSGAPTAASPPLFSISAGASPTAVTNPNCPAVITFSATISYSGSGGTFQYVWLRSDGALQTTPGQVSFSGPGTQTVTTTWTLGAPTPTFQPFKGWEQLKVLAPTVLSNVAGFTLTCAGPSFSITATAVPQTVITTCPTVITFAATIRDSGGGGTFQYVWLRSDGMQTSPGVVSFSEPGTQTVTTTWRLGAPLVHVTGWEQLKIMPSAVLSSAVLSNLATFTLSCT